MSRRLDRSLLAMMAVSLVATVFFATFAIVRHRMYHSMTMDFAFFDQIVWNTSQGHLFETSFVPYNFMGQHVEPILLLFAAVYRITPAPEWMLVTQAVATGIAGILLYLLARERLSRPWLAVVVSISFLLSPTLHSGLAFDYHSEVMASAFIFSGLLLLYRGQTWAGVAALLGMLLLKEDAALVLIGLAIPLFLMRERRAAYAISAIGLLWVILVVGLYMPWVRGESSDLEARYEHLGSGAGGIASGIVDDPVSAMEYMLGTNQQSAIVRNLAMQGGLPLVAPFTLLAAGPVAALQFLSSHPPQQGLRLQYGAQVLPLVIIATVEGLRHVERITLSDRLLPATGVLLLLSTTIGFLIASPFSPVVLLDPPVYPSNERRATIGRGIEHIPEDASVSAQSGLAAHLSQRERIWEFPVLMDAEYVILDLDGVVARPYEDTYSSEVARLEGRGYALIWAEGSVRVYHAGAMANRQSKEYR